MHTEHIDRQHRCNTDLYDNNIVGSICLLQEVCMGKGIGGLYVGNKPIKHNRIVIVLIFSYSGEKKATKNSRFENFILILPLLELVKPNIGHR